MLQIVIAKAEIDRTRCYPWVAGHGCRVCANLCPVPKKAVIVKQYWDQITNGTSIERPYVIKENCIGCGICENNCPVPRQKAIHVFRKDVKNPYPQNKSFEKDYSR